MNTNNLIGRLGRDIDLVYTPGGKAVINFDLAVTRDKEHTDWIPCVAWEKTAELIAQYAQKGSHIGIEGRIGVRSYENKEGKKIKVVEVTVNRVHFLDKKQDKQIEQPVGPTIVIDDKDLPF